MLLEIRGMQGCSDLNYIPVRFERNFSEVSRGACHNPIGTKEVNPSHRNSRDREGIGEVAAWNGGT